MTRLAASWPAFPVGDHRRPPIGRAVVSTLGVSSVFIGYVWVAKEIRPLYVHTPWADDPYDAVISFAFFFVPLLAGMCFLRAPSCQRSRPLPIRRARELLLASRLALAIIGATLLGEWVSLALHEHRQSWNETTAALVGVLGLISLLTAAAALQVRVALRHARDTIDDGGPEWWTDVFAVLDSQCSRLRGGGAIPRRLLRFVDQRIVASMRAHPVRSALTTSVPFALLVAGLQGIEESGVAWRPLLLFASLSGCSMFAFVILAGSHLRLIDRPRTLRGSARRAIDALVFATASVPITLSFRDQLRGLTGGLAGRHSGHLLEVAIAIALGIGLLVFSVETRLGKHDQALKKRS